MASDPFHRRIALGIGGARLLFLGLAVGLPLLPSLGSAEPLRTGPKYYAIIWNFGSGEDGSFPNGGLAMNGDQLYGTTQNGGAHSYGTVFELAPAGKSYAEKVIWSFGPAPDGTNPYAGVITDGTNAIYGTTAYGGFANYGTVFKLTPSGSGYSEQVIWKFGYGQDGQYLYSGLIERNGALLGTTQRGGLYSYGTVFALTPSGTTYTEQVLWNLGNGNDGQDPHAGLAGDSRGALYGTTEVGGTHRCGPGTCGTVFKLTPSGTGYSERVIWNFNGADGAEPSSTLIEYGGAQYGTTRLGGAFGAGTAFKLTPSSVYGYSEQVMWSFGRGRDGATPEGGLVVKNGAFYGVTVEGGTGGASGCVSVGCGTLFELTPSGSNYRERVVWSFSNGQDGAGPYGPLIVKGKALYGTTAGGGLYGGGTAYELIP